MLQMHTPRRSVFAKMAYNSGGFGWWMQVILYYMIYGAFGIVTMVPK